MLAPYLLSLQRAVAASTVATAVGTMPDEPGEVPVARVRFLSGSDPAIGFSSLAAAGAYLRKNGILDLRTI